MSWVVPHHSYVKVLTLRISEYEMYVFGDKVFKGVIKLKWKY